MKHNEREKKRKYYFIQWFNCYEIYIRRKAFGWCHVSFVHTKEALNSILCLSFSFLSCFGFLVKMWFQLSSIFNLDLERPTIHIRHACTMFLYPFSNLCTKSVNNLFFEWNYTNKIKNLLNLALGNWLIGFITNILFFSKWLHWKFDCSNKWMLQWIQ